MRTVTDTMIIALFALSVVKGGIMRRVSESMVIALLAFSVLAGCSTQSAKTVESEKTVQYSPERDQAHADPIVIEKRTTRTEETAKSEGQSVGLLSGTVHVVGQALALPFRVMGGLIGLAF